MILHSKITKITPKRPQITPEVPKSVHLGHIFLLGLAKTVFFTVTCYMLVHVLKKKTGDMHHYMLPAKKLEHIGCSPFFRRVEGVREEGEDGGTEHDVEEGGVQPDKTNSRWLEMQKPRGSRPGLRETINLPLLRS